MNDYHASAAYYYKNAYGLTLERSETQGSADALLYPGASNHRPDSSGWTMQADFTPFGTENSFGWPHLNTRIFVQGKAYDKFNGVKRNYDGAGRNAADSNTLFMGTWFAF